MTIGILVGALIIISCLAIMWYALAKMWESQANQWEALSEEYRDLWEKSIEREKQIYRVSQEYASLAQMYLDRLSGETMPDEWFDD